jgi:hypothetical protein
MIFIIIIIKLICVNLEYKKQYLRQLDVKILFYLKEIYPI